MLFKPEYKVKPNNKICWGDYGIMSEQDARKKYMSVIRCMSGKTEKEKDIIRGSGFFRTLRKVTGIGKKQFLGSDRKMGRQHISSNINAIHIIEKNLDKVDWDSLSRNPNAIDILEKI